MREVKKPACHLARFPGGARPFCGHDVPREDLTQERHVWLAMDADHHCRRCERLADEEARREVEHTEGIARWDRPVLTTAELRRRLRHAERIADLFTDTERSLIVRALAQAERTMEHRKHSRTSAPASVEV